MRRAVLYGVAVVCLTLLFATAGPQAQRMISGNGNDTSSNPVTVTVSNFPASQSVTGVVELAHAVNVTGSVAVTNFPTVQQVAGTVTVGNLPVDGGGNVKVAAASTARHLVGFTSTLVPGTIGVLGLNRACNAEFRDSRICTSGEVAETVAPPVFSDAVGWVRPVPAPMFTGNIVQTQDTISGLLSPNSAGELCCQGFANPSSTGLTVNQEGQFHLQGCGVSASVACCGY